MKGVFHLKNINFAKKIICGVVAGSMLLTAGVYAYSDNTTQNTTTNGKHHIKMFNGGNNTSKKLTCGLKSVFDEMVKEGTLTQAKVDAMQNYMQQKMQEMKKMTKEQRQQQPSEQKTNILDEMASKGIITQADANAIKEKQKTMFEKKYRDNLDSLVQKGIITQVESDKINSYIKAAREEKKQLMERLKGMAPEERKTYFENNKNSRIDIIQKMVDDGVITADKAKEIRKAIPDMQNKHFKGNKKHSVEKDKA